jgi:hypothetical protein
MWGLAATCVLRRNVNATVTGISGESAMTCLPPLQSCYTACAAIVLQVNLRASSESAATFAELASQQQVTVP